MRIEDVIGSAISRAGVVRVRSALNPFLWCFVWTVAFLVAGYFLKDDPVTKYVCLGFAVFPLLVALAVGVSFALKHPDRLQSEEFVIRQRELQMLYKQGASPEIIDVLRVTARTESLAGTADGGDDS